MNFLSFNYYIINMRLLQILIGISGAGKSTYIKKHNEPNYTILSLDTIRKEILGDVSDQSKNKEIYKIFLERFEDLIKNTDNDICIDNTNLDEKSIFNLLDICNKYKEEIYLIPNFFLDSFNWELCRDRVKKDRTDRSRTDTVEVNGVPLHKQMCDRFTSLFKKMAQNEDAWADFITDKYPCVKAVRFWYV